MDVGFYFDRQGKPMEREAWMETYVDMDGRRIGYEKRGDVWVSTVWLGLNHQYGDGPPLIFETMIFGGENDGEQWRYATEEEAEAGHAAAVVLAFGDSDV